MPDDNALPEIKDQFQDGLDDIEDALRELMEDPETRVTRAHVQAKIDTLQRCIDNLVEELESQRPRDQMELVIEAPPEDGRGYGKRLLDYLWENRYVWLLCVALVVVMILTH